MRPEQPVRADGRQAPAEGSQQCAGTSLVRLLVALVVVLAAGTVHAPAVGASVREVPRGSDASVGHGHGFEPSLGELLEKPKFKDGSAAAARDGKFPKDRELIGTVRTWVVNDKFFGVDFFKDFTLRGVGRTVEVWVASGDDGVSRGLEYPAGDCRNGTLTRVTDEQIDYLMHEFDQTIRPRQAEVFGDPLARDGSDALLPRVFPSIPADAYRGDGRRTVVLVDNIRDAEFYGPGSGQVSGYIAPRFIEYFDRNVLVLTGVNWDHRLGKRPLETLDAADPCVRRRAWPFHIEAVLAHEFHHVRFFDQVPTIGLAVRADPNDHVKMRPLVGEPGEACGIRWPGSVPALYVIDMCDRTYDPRSYDRPIAVLTGPNAVSSGDQVALRMTYHPRARIFGQSTNGAFNAPCSLNVDPGWRIPYACADAYRIDDPHNYLTHDELPVDEPVWLTPDDVAQGKDTVVDAALRWINSQTP